MCLFGCLPDWGRAGSDLLPHMVRLRLSSCMLALRPRQVGPATAEVARRAHAVIIQPLRILLQQDGAVELDYGDEPARALDMRSWLQPDVLARGLAAVKCWQTAMPTARCCIRGVSCESNPG